jgi:hypothetical protein
LGNEKNNILGVDLFILTENSIQPFMEFSSDYSITGEDDTAYRKQGN